MDNEIIAIEKGNDTYDLHVMWSIHHKCNYACSYCPSELHDGEMSHLRLRGLRHFIDTLYEHYNVKLGFKRILISFTGGEPTLWKDFKPFLEYTAALDIRLGITTNASVSVNFWKGISHYFDYICLSYHSESANNVRFIETFEFLHNDKDTVIPSVRFVMHKEDEYWTRSIAMLEKLKQFSNWTYECVHLLEDYNTHPRKTVYNSLKKEEFLRNNAFNSQFLDSTLVKEPKTKFDYNVRYFDGDLNKLDENHLINNDLVNFYGWKCNIGLEQLLIAPTGDILSSGCSTGRKDWHGTIQEPDKIVFPSKGIICKTKVGCYCPTDIRISKTKI